MTRASQILLATHLLALAGAYGFTKIRIPSDTSPETKATPVRSKSSSRERPLIAGDGPLLMAGFLKEQKEGKSKYEELKATLRVAEDLKGACVAAIAGLSGGEGHPDRTPDEWAARIAEFEVRVLHWMKQNPEEAMDFLGTDPACAESELLHVLQEHVFIEVAKDNGVLRSMPWLTKHHATLSILASVTVDEMKAGGGLALFTRIEEALVGSAREKACRDLFLDQPGYLSSVGEATPFGDREKLLELAGKQPDAARKCALLAGFGRSSERAATWLLEWVGRGDLEGDLANQIKGNLGDAVLAIPSMDLEKRVEARRATEGNEVKPRESIINELVGGDVTNLLEKGRDWRYEFRHGRASLDDIQSAVRGEVPIPPEAEEAVLVTLYRHLSEEDPARALPLLEGVSEERRRAALFEFTWTNHGDVEPDTFLRFLADVPEPVTAQEIDFRTKGWNWKARGFLARYGDDYVEWVQQMPPGIDKDTAMNSLVWATREQNPAKARELNDRLYSKKP
ncbi:MAG: hypothetical protein V4689_20845 [Verrucomicrobiota bacterium]